MTDEKHSAVLADLEMHDILKDQRLDDEADRLTTCPICDGRTTVTVEDRDGGWHDVPCKRCKGRGVL